MSPSVDVLAYLPLGQGTVTLFNAGSLVLAVIFVIFSFDYANYVRQRTKLGNTPIVGDDPYLLRRLGWTENRVNLGRVLQRGYDTFSRKAKPWAYWGQHDDLIVVMPPGTGEEIKNADMTKLNFLKAAEDNYHFRLHSTTNGRDHVDAIRLSSSKNMNQLHQALVRQSDESISLVLDGYAKTREPFAGFLTIWHLVNIVAASYIGPDFPKDPEFIKAIESYGIDMTNFVFMYFRVPTPLRKVFWYLSPQGFRVRTLARKLTRFIGDEVRRAIDTWRKTGRTPDQYTMLGALLDVKRGSGQLKQDAQAMDQADEERQIRIFSDELRLTAFEAAGPPACLLTQMLFESIEHPDIVKPLRDEIASALVAHGGEWSHEMFNSLPRLESFTRETLRADGPTLFSLTRSVLQPTRLKSGLTLTPGTMITGAAWFIQMDEAHYPRAHEFDPWRFYDEKTNTATTKSTTATNTFLAFGYGSQSCPGRFLGVRLTQIVFAKMLMRYEFGWEDGQKGRPENVVLPGQLLPQYTATIVLRERAGV